MKELIEKLEKLKDLIEVENEVDVDSSIKVINEAIQALTSVKNDSAEDVDEETIFGLLESFLVVMNNEDLNDEDRINTHLYYKNALCKIIRDFANADKKQHAIGFYLFCDANGWKWNQETLDFERFDGVQLLEASAEDLFDHYIDMQNEKTERDN